MPHVATFGYGVGVGGEITDVYPYFAAGVFHLIASAVLGLGGVFHALYGPARLEDGNPFFSQDWRDKDQMTKILGYHLCVLGLGSLAFSVNWVFLGGAYDTWAPGGGAVHLIRPTLNPIKIHYWLSSTPWGVGGWMVGVNSMEDIVG